MVSRLGSSALLDVSSYEMGQVCRWPLAAFARSPAHQVCHISLEQNLQNFCLINCKEKQVKTGPFLMNSQSTQTLIGSRNNGWRSELIIQRLSRVESLPAKCRMGSICSGNGGPEKLFISGVDKRGIIGEMARQKFLMSRTK